MHMVSLLCMVKPPLQFDVHKNQFHQIDHVDMIAIIALVVKKIQFNKIKPYYHVGALTGL